MKKKLTMKFFPLPLILIGLLIVILVIVEYGGMLRLAARGTDNKPTIDFTWTPVGRVFLKEMIGNLRVEDDYAIDFNTLKIYIVELDRTMEVTRPDIIGKSFEQTLSFALFEDNPTLIQREQMTLRISVADDRGQKTEIERVIKLKSPANKILLQVE